MRTARWGYYNQVHSPGKSKWWFEKAYFAYLVSNYKYISKIIKIIKGTFHFLISIFLTERWIETPQNKIKKYRIFFYHVHILVRGYFLEVMQVWALALLVAGCIISSESRVLNQCEQVQALRAHGIPDYQLADCEYRW